MNDFDASNPKTGCPLTSMGNLHVKEVYFCISSSHCLNDNGIAEDLDVSNSSFHTILTDNLQTHCYAAKFMHCRLNDDQNMNHGLAFRDSATLAELFKCRSGICHNSTDLDTS
ncbi:hypothetical protein AVEN_159061-1 [Araneus ventricosus]|uniref:Uncharacterized protein n=1 Tax=Araneus ventricosus TaxID=182803 RepID=A0A4Y2B7Z8_ARAVE|nr:hypothetical protein AVEN_159061-1 [Araneus ventricosus]